LPPVASEPAVTTPDEIEIEQDPDASARALADSLRMAFASRRHTPKVDSVTVEGRFPSTTLIARFDQRGYRFPLFTGEEGAPLGSWPEIREHFLVYRDVDRFAVELHVAIEEGLDSRIWDGQWSEPDSDGVRWYSV